MKNTFLFMISFIIVISQSMYVHTKEPDNKLIELHIKLEEYIKPWQRKITIHYQSLMSDTEPFALAVMTKGIGYEKSQDVIANIASTLIPIMN